jgi:hypothetical protein
VGIQLLRAHVQIAYYTQLAVALAFTVWAVGRFRERKAGSVLSGAGLLAGALIAGVLVSAVLNLSVHEYARYSIRGGGETGGVSYDYATGWSFPPAEIATFFVPSFMGFGGESYWGAVPFTDFPQYFGLVVLVLAAAALALRRDRFTVFLALLAGLSLVVSFGKHFPVLYGPMFKFLPFFNKFRAPNMIHILFEFAMVCLAALGVQSLLEAGASGRNRRGLKAALAAVGAVLGLLLLTLLLGKDAYVRWAAKAGGLAGAAHAMSVRDAFWALGLFGVTAVLVWRAAAGRVRRGVFAGLLALLVVLDLWLVDRRFVQFRPRGDVNAYFRATPEVDFLKAQPGPFRIFPVQSGRAPNWYAYHTIENVFGYHAAKLRSVQEAIDAFGVGNDGYLFKYLARVDGNWAWKADAERPRAEERAHHAFLRLMNVRYVLSPVALPDSSLRLVLPPQVQGGSAVFEFTGALPRAFFPRSVVRVADGAAGLRLMAGGGFDPAETAVLEAGLPGPVVPSDSNRVEIVERGLHFLRADVRVATPSLLVFSEMHYPEGWKAAVDGRETPLYRANHVLRAVYLEPGAREVRMEFRPRSFRLGLTVTLAAALLLAAGAGAGAWAGRRGRRDASP